MFLPLHSGDLAQIDGYQNCGKWTNAKCSISFVCPYFQTSPCSSFQTWVKGNLEDHSYLAGSAKFHRFSVMCPSDRLLSLSLFELRVPLQYNLAMTVGTTKWSRANGLSRHFRTHKPSSLWFNISWHFGDLIGWRCLDCKMKLNHPSPAATFFFCQLCSTQKDTRDMYKPLIDFTCRRLLPLSWCP